MFFRMTPGRCDTAASITGRFFARLAIAILIAFTFSGQTPAQTIENSEGQSGRVMGTVVDVSGGPVAGATVVLSGADAAERRTAATSETGYFEFDEVKPGVPERVNISAEGFADWTSPDITLAQGEFKS